MTESIPFATKNGDGQEAPLGLEEINEKILTLCFTFEFKFNNQSHVQDDKNTLLIQKLYLPEKFLRSPSNKNLLISNKASKSLPC